MDTNKLYVGNLKYDLSPDDLQRVFSAHGTVLSVNIIERKGFGFVEMETSEMAAAAKEALDGTELEGRMMRVDAAKPKQDHR